MTERIVYWPTSKHYGVNKFMREVALPFFKKKDNIETLLDFGCGRWLRDALYFTKNGFEVYCVELEEQLEKIDKRKYLDKGINSIASSIPDMVFDAAFINFVIDVTETREKRKRIIEDVCSYVTDKGYVTLSVISKKGVSGLKTKEKFNDGYKFLHSKKDNLFTFLKGYDTQTFHAIMKECDLTIVKDYQNSHALYSIAQV